MPLAIWYRDMLPRASNDRRAQRLTGDNEPRPPDRGILRAEPMRSLGDSKQQGNWLES